MTAEPARVGGDILVAGGSVAGVRTAGALRRRGFEGRIRILSAERLPNYYRPALSKQYLAGEQEIPDLALPIDDDLGLEVWTGARATALDTRHRRLTVRWADRVVELGYSGLVIATGLAPRRLELPALEGIHYVRELDDAGRLRAELHASPRVVVVGGGLIGCEVAATCRKLGLDVTLVEPARTLLRPVFGSTVGELVTDLHRAHGVRVLTGTGVTGVDGRGRVESVTLTTGDRVAADVVVVAVGSRPQTDWLQGSGLDVDDGVLCAANLAAVGAESVVAVGDVARPQDPLTGTAVRTEHWDNGVRQSGVAAQTLLEGPQAPPYTAQSTFWTNQYDLALHVYGHPGADDELDVLEGDLRALGGVAAYHRAGRVTAIVTANQPHRLRTHRGLVGSPRPADVAAPTTHS